jgi:hypothetical protein
VERIVNGVLKLMLRNLLEFLQGGIYVLGVVLSALLLCHLFEVKPEDVTMLLLITLALLSILHKDS